MFCLISQSLGDHLLESKLQRQSCDSERYPALVPQLNRISTCGYVSWRVYSYVVAKRKPTRTEADMLVLTFVAKSNTSNRMTRSVCAAHVVPAPVSQTEREENTSQKKGKKQKEEESSVSQKWLSRKQPEHTTSTHTWSGFHRACSKEETRVQVLRTRVALRKQVFRLEQECGLTRAALRTEEARACTKGQLGAWPTSA
eukprot:713236-Rhodomonas_salina.3